MSTPGEIAVRIAKCLSEDGVPYGIGDALALGAWGAPRATKDVDMSIFAADDLPRMFDSLERAGLMFDRAHAERDIDRIAMFKAFSGHTAIDIFVSNHPFFDDMLKRRREVAKMVQPGDRRFAILDDLERRFVDKR